MAENEVIVPTSGNPALDPTKVKSGLVASSAPKQKDWAQEVEESEKNRRRSLSESDRQKEDLDEYWKRRNDEKRINPDTKPKHTQTDLGGGGGSRGGRGVQFGISNSSGVDYAVMKFKSRVMQDACSPKFTSAFPMNTHLPQVCGPFRPITLSSQGGLPQSSLQESIGTGIIPNMDA